MGIMGIAQLVGDTVAILLVKQCTPPAPPTVNPVTTALIGVVAGAALTGILNFFLQRSADDRRFKQEAAMQDLRWEQEDKQRLQDTRARVYSEFWGIVKLAEIAPKLRSADVQDRFARNMVEMAMYGTPKVQDAGKQLYLTIVQIVDEEDNVIDTQRPKLRQQEEIFKQAIKDDLGLDIEG